MSKVADLENFLAQKFPLFSKSIAKGAETFGPSWSAALEEELKKSFGDGLEFAAEGYAQFSLEALKLQKKFDRTQKYETKSYEQAAAEVYFNETYMKSRYLPGLLLSHYLWPHHYRQQLWMRDQFLPRVSGVSTFCDVGVGSGFYSRFLLQHVPQILGTGLDVSEYSLHYTESLIRAWGLEARYRTKKGLIEDWNGPEFESFLSIEVLEHLTDPLNFLRSLRRIVKKGAFGVITAAIDAPNRDHIYLYRSLDEIAVQLRAAHFMVLDAQNFPAFPVSPENPTAPQNACFIVQAC